MRGRAVTLANKLDKRRCRYVEVMDFAVASKWHATLIVQLDYDIACASEKGRRMFQRVSRKGGETLEAYK